MTEEQIKQNAKNFAINETGGLAIKYFPCEKGYIAGAHSRDEEIEELKERLEFADESIADADKWIAKYKLDIANLETKLNQLRNPWISVEERLPEEDKDVFVRKVCTNGIFHLVGKVLNGGKWYCYGFGWQDANAITHWMPIPQI